MLVIQDPTNEQSSYLLESLLDAFQGAQKIAGAFAFASSAGVRLFTGNKLFQEVALNHTVDLIVGVDAVTNTGALDSLAEITREYSNVQVRAFMNPKPTSLFHPKFCWSKKENGGQIITGSGNLTEGGLLGHWEAYSVEQLQPVDVAAIESMWNDWTERHRASLLPLDDSSVRERAHANNILSPEGDLPTLVSPTREPAPEEGPVTTLVLSGTAEVLVKEIPSSGGRWKQANFHREEFEDFFGARAGRTVVFGHVNSDGTMVDYEHNRQAVVVSSHNYRFELAAASGIAYPPPTAGRPIGVFIRMAPRRFFYRLLLPGDTEYATVSTLLQQQAGPSAQQMRSVRMSVAELRVAWPSSPFWNLPATT